MTVATPADFTMSHTIDQQILADLETEFTGYRSRIASLSIHASGALVSMFSALGPADGDVIDIEAIERQQLTLEFVPAESDTVRELAIA